MKHAAFAVLAMLASCSNSESHTVPDVQPEDEVWLSPDQMHKANIKVVDATTQALPMELTVGGKVAFDDLHVSHVFSPVTGRVTRVLAKPGQKVSKGAALVGILSPDIGTAFSDVVKAQADLQTLELDFHREQRLYAKDATSQRSLEAAEDAYRRAAAEYARAQQRAALLHGSAIDLVSQEYVLRSFIDGEVIARTVNPGAEVAGQYSGGNSNELFTIGDIKKVSVWADVQDTELGKLKVGDDVEVRVIAHPGKHYDGKIDLVANTVDPVLRTGRIRATMDNQNEDLKPEMFATVSILRPAEQRLAVPRDAVVGINEARYVYVQTTTRSDGRIVFKRRPVRIGEERDGAIPIVDGLAAGEKVVETGAVMGLEDDDKVYPTRPQLDDSKITTAVVESRKVSDIVTIGGKIAFDDTKISHVFSPVNGRITRVLAQPGQRVAKGAPLVAIQSPDVGGYMADVVKAEADKVQAQHEYQRQKELFDAGVGAKRTSRPRTRRCARPRRSTSAPSS
jgi:cobalt-zinc-cadmium efflux system membrane fusion protein